MGPSGPIFLTEDIVKFYEYLIDDQIRREECERNLLNKLSVLREQNHCLELQEQFRDCVYDIVGIGSLKCIKLLTQDVRQLTRLVQYCPEVAIRFWFYSQLLDENTAQLPRRDIRFFKACIDYQKNEAFEASKVDCRDKIAAYLTFCDHFNCHNNVMEVFKQTKYKVLLTHMRYAAKIVLERGDAGLLFKILGVIEKSFGRDAHETFLTTIVASSQFANLGFEELGSFIDLSERLSLEWENPILSRRAAWSKIMLTATKLEFREVVATIERADILSSRLTGSSDVDEINLIDFMYSVEFLKKKNEYPRIEKICRTYLSDHPSSLNAALIYAAISSKGQAFGRSGFIYEQIAKNYFALTLSKTWSHLNCRLGRWLPYKLNFENRFRKFEKSPNHKLRFAAAETFYLEAAPFLGEQQKLSITSTILNKKADADPLNIWYRGGKSIGVFTADARTHAMWPYVKQLAEALEPVATEVIWFLTNNPVYDDEKTDEIKSKFEVIRISEHLNEGDLELIRNKQLAVAVDLSQRTAGNAISYFEKRIGKVQVSIFWGAGYTSHCQEMDFLIGDPDVFSAYEQEHFFESFVALTDSTISHPTAYLDIKREHDVKRKIGVFCRPMRINESFLHTLRELQKVTGLEIIFGHYQYNGPDTIDFFKRYLESLGFEPSMVTVKNAPLEDLLNGVDLVVDAWPVGSPTTSKDIILNGKPIFVWGGGTFSTQLLCVKLFKRLELHEFIYDDTADLIAKIAKFYSHPWHVDYNAIRIEVESILKNVQMNLRETILSWRQ
jgi:hypothetical protein